MPEALTGTNSTHPHCAYCDYDLSGLIKARCPECGRPFDPAERLDAAQHRPTIAWEAARGWRRAAAFFVTSATVLFAPWIFARQIARVASLPLAFVFALLCFVPPSIVSIVENPRDLWFLATWLLTAATYIIVQALLFTLVDPARRRAWRRTLKFWLCVGLYTSAVVATEFICGPPVIMLDDVVSALTERTPYESLRYFLDDDRFLWLPQLVLWSAGVACVFHHRCHIASWRRRSAALVGIGVAFAVLLLFVLHVQYVALSIMTLMDRWFDVQF